MPEQISFYLGGLPAGSGEIRSAIVHGSLFPPSGRVYFCPICSNIWFHAQVESRPTEAINRPCSKHLPGSYFGGTSLGSVLRQEVPGSLWDQFSPEFNKSWSPLLIKYELLVQLQAAIARAPGENEFVRTMRMVYDYHSRQLEFLHALDSPRSA